MRMREMRGNSPKENQSVAPSRKWNVKQAKTTRVYPGKTGRCPQEAQHGGVEMTGKEL